MVGREGGGELELWKAIAHPTYSTLLIPTPLRGPSSASSLTPSSSSLHSSFQQLWHWVPFLVRIFFWKADKTRLVVRKRAERRRKEGEACYFFLCNSQRCNAKLNPEKEEDFLSIKNKIQKKESRTKKERRRRGVLLLLMQLFSVTKMQPVS